MLIQSNYFKRTTSDVRTHYSVFKEQYFGEKRSIADSPVAVKPKEPVQTYKLRAKFKLESLILAQNERWRRA